MKQKFYVDDRVVGNGVQSGVNITGMIGTVVEVDDNGDYYCIDFDNRHELFHSCGGLAKNKHGWNCNYSVLDPYREVDDWVIASDICTALL